MLSLRTESDLEGQGKKSLYARRFGSADNNKSQSLALITSNLGMNSVVSGIQMRYEYTFRYLLNGPYFPRDERPFQARIKEWLRKLMRRKPPLMKTRKVKAVSSTRKSTFAFSRRVSFKLTRDIMESRSYRERVKDWLSRLISLRNSERNRERAKREFAAWREQCRKRDEEENVRWAKMEKVRQYIDLVSCMVPTFLKNEQPFQVRVKDWLAKRTNCYYTINHRIGSRPSDSPEF